MSEYFNNLKWIISGKTETNKYDTNKLSYDLEVSRDSESDFENEYTKIESKDLYSNIMEIKNEYEKIQTELIKKEQLVRKRLDSDTIEQIKSHCEEYVNDEIKIIKDFALIMESFNHIKEKLINFESGIKDFETDIKNKTTNQDESNAELDNRINAIDTKLDNTIKLMDQINSNSNDIMEKILQLENIITEHSVQRQEILEKINNVYRDNSNYLIFFTNYFNMNYLNSSLKFKNNTMLIAMLGGSVIGTIYFRYFVKK